jgi:hypothetical protein
VRDDDHLRRRFLQASLLGGAAQAAVGQNLPVARENESGGTGNVSYQVDAVVERRRSGKPRQGQVVCAIQPHCDDVPIFAAGTILKLIDEGCTGYLITMSDDSMAGGGAS